MFCALLSKQTQAFQVTSRTHKRKMGGRQEGGEEWRRGGGEEGRRGGGQMKVQLLARTSFVIVPNGPEKLKINWKVRKRVGAGAM